MKYVDYNIRLEEWHLSGAINVPGKGIGGLYGRLRDASHLLAELNHECTARHGVLVENREEIAPDSDRTKIIMGFFVEGSRVTNTLEISKSSNLGVLETKVRAGITGTDERLLDSFQNHYDPQSSSVKMEKVPVFKRD